MNPFQAIASALMANGTAPAPGTSPGVQGVARALMQSRGADGHSVPAQASSPAVQRVADAMPAQSASAPQAVAQPAMNSRLQAAYATMNSPYASKGEREIASIIVQQSLKGTDFETITRPDGSVYRVPKTGSGAPTQVFGPQSKPEDRTGDMREYDVYVAQEKAAGRTPVDFTPWMRGNKASGASSISIDTKGGTKFAEKANEYQAKRYYDMATAADEAVVLRSDVETLSSLLEGIKTGRGTEARLGLAQMAKGVGLDGIADKLTGGKMDEMEAALSIMDKLTPRMRVPGSGATSDMEMRTFRNALPSLLKQPGGNGIVTDTYRGMLDYQAAAGDFARQAMRGEITQAEADKQIKNLPSPFQRFRDYQKAQNGGGSTGQGNPAPAVNGVSGQTRSGLKWSVQ
jgi:hypothetical protein